MEQLSKQLKSDDIIVADDGGHLTWAVQGLKIKKSKIIFGFWKFPYGLCFTCCYLEHQLRKIKKKLYV